ncbi:glucosidase 2 subunit beta-like protein [Phytophthora cinnamomi]|uniref:glucosidase 2 subunit beta-like protein n=1 Tax=Phytophthora cinnamomi TaxID=4785 RepID=UPI003559DC16|nr:glucosidase 2 subunit beta-like protein [Phytophthora cinnamomi]
MAPSSVKRSLLAFLVAVIVATACMLVLAMQVPSVAAVHAPSSDFKRFGIGEVVDEDDDDDDDDDDWDFMDDDAILSLSQQLNAGARGDTKHSSGICVDSLPVELVDDDYCDCEDGSDEPNTAACSHVLLGSFRPPFGRQFSCKADDKLVSLAAVDDGVCDCCDGSDEREGLCAETCEQQWQQRLERLRGRLEMLQRGQRTRKEYLARAVDKVKTLNEDFERLEESYQAGQRAFEELQGRVQQNPELQGHLEQSYSVLRRVQYVAYVQSRVVDPGTFTDAAWKPAFSELVGKCFSYTVDEKELKDRAVVPQVDEGRTPNQGRSVCCG